MTKLMPMSLAIIRRLYSAQKKGLLAIEGEHVQCQPLG
jgi:hypothetical protein